MNNDADQKVNNLELVFDEVEIQAYYAKLDLDDAGNMDSAIWCARYQFDKVKTEIESLQKLNDMNQAIIDGMRGVVAMARAVNNQTPDLRVTHQLKRFDADKLSDYRDAEIESLRAENDELKKWKKSMGGAMPLELVDRSRFLLKQAYETKLSAANAQMDAVAEILEYYKTRGIIELYRRFKR